LRRQQTARHCEYREDASFVLLLQMASLNLFIRQCAPALLLTLPVLAADFATTARLVNEAKDEKALTEAFGEEALKTNKAVMAEGGQLLFAVRSSTPATASVDDAPGKALRRVGKSSLWVGSDKTSAGTTHNVQFMADGKATAAVENVRS